MAITSKPTISGLVTATTSITPAGQLAHACPQVASEIPTSRASTV
jgi:hypothetical protein